MADFPGTNPVTTLATSLSGNTTTVVLTSSSGFPPFGTARVGATPFVYTSITSNTLNGSNQTMGTITAGERVDLLYKLDNPKISYYSSGSAINTGWQVSNADEEFLTLSQSAYFTTSTPSFKYCKLEINGHFDLAFDY